MLNLSVIVPVYQEDQGLSMARNNGREVATGEYVLFVDGDDLLIDNSLSYLINKTISSKPDLVNLLLQEAPDLQFTNGLKQRVTSFLFRQMPNVYVRSRHLYGKYAENVIIPFYNHKLKRFFISKTI